MWAFVVVDKFPRDLFAEVFHKINEIDAQQLERMSDTDQSQWYQADLALRLQVPELAKMFGLARPLRKKFGRVFLRAFGADSVLLTCRNYKTNYSSNIG